MDVTIRKIQKQEYPLLDHFLYEAIFVPEGVEPPPKTIITSPELQVYVEHFGESKDDWGLVAEVEGKIVGAVWVRIMNDYGHIDEKTPSLAISLYKEYRGFGIGTAMMKEILALLKAHGYSRWWGSGWDRRSRTAPPLWPPGRSRWQRSWRWWR